MNMNKKGFTLTEILIVLVIAGILLALILPNSVKAIAKAKTAEGKANSKNCNAAILACYVGEGNDWTNCGSFSNLTSNGYTNIDFGTTVAISGDATVGYTCK